MSKEVIVSHSQFLEDVFLHSALADINRGFYIDVGAYHPLIDSVTKHFYDRGWTGINIEPISDYYRLFVDERPRDINLNIALSDTPGQGVIHKIDIAGSGGLSTLRDDLTAVHSQEIKSAVISKHPTEICTLDQVIVKYAYDKQIHFLKIDVEGLEPAVIRGLNLQSRRPWIVVVESIDPNTWEQNYLEWEHLLTSANYLFACGFAANRFYVAEERAELAERFKNIPYLYSRRVESDAAVTFEDFRTDLADCELEKSRLKQKADDIESSVVWKLSRLISKTFGKSLDRTRS